MLEPRLVTAKRTITGMLRAIAIVIHSAKYISFDLAKAA